MRYKRSTRQTNYLEKALRFCIYHQKLSRRCIFTVYFAAETRVIYKKHRFSLFYSKRCSANELLKSHLEVSTVTATAGSSFEQLEKIVNK